MIQTQAANSAGIIAQSIAGHAGAGGGQIPASLAAFGANGGSAGAAGTVKVTNGAAIRTNSDESAAIFAESAGGGGGNGGASFGLFYSGGGNGGIGGAGGQVAVNNTGSLTTSGANSQGILAQSVGGAGGDGGIPGGVASALGGRAAQGSNGQTVTVVNSGFISTGAQPIKDVKIEQATVDPACSFACSDGILAQSVGGGGGVGGTAVGGWFSLGGTGGGGGDGGTVDVTNTGHIITRLNDSVGLAAQSIGGGGGDGGGSVSVQALGAVAIGAKGGAGGNGGLVQVLPTSGMQMQTVGANSTGILAQSIGGGGGNGGYAAAISGGTNFAVSVAIGGSGAAGGNGREAIVNTMDPNYKGLPDTIKTAGDDSDGILAQSIGQGGGNGGFTVSAAGAAKGASIALAMGGGGGAGGNGGVASITSDATIKTEGLQLLRLGRAKHRQGRWQRRPNRRRRR
jgi:hypothetical protein